MTITSIIDGVLLQSGAVSRQELIDSGAKAIFSLGHWPDDPIAGVMQFRWTIDDGPVPDPWILHSIAELICTLLDPQDARNRITPILIRCDAGMNRSSLLTAEVLKILHADWDPERVIGHIRARIPMALMNNAFLAYIRTGSNGVTFNEEDSMLVQQLRGVDAYTSPHAAFLITDEDEI